MNYVIVKFILLSLLYLPANPLLIFILEASETHFGNNGYKKNEKKTPIRVLFLQKVALLLSFYTRSPNNSFIYSAVY